MRSKILICLGLLPVLASAQVEQALSPDSALRKKPLKFAQSFIWAWFDSSEQVTIRRFYYYSVKQDKFYNVDSLVAKVILADSLCKDITILSFKAEKYFMLLQEAYLELRRLKSDSLANRLEFVAFDRKFRICK